MNLEKYTMDADEELFTFEFESHGPKGRIRKIVQYTKPLLLKEKNSNFDL
jgi:hypothetical protein